MIESSHSQLCNKNSCSVKLQGEPLEHNPRTVNSSCLLNCTENEFQFLVKNIMNLAIFCQPAVLQNNSRCLLLNDTNKCHMRYCPVCWTKYKHKKKTNTLELN